MSTTTPCITDSDRCRLGSLLTTREDRAWGDPHWLTQLEFLLEDAQSVDAGRAPESLVTMNSTVELVDLKTNDPLTVTLAYPKETDLVSDGVSVFDPLGIALLGRHEGDVLECPEEQCGRLLQVAEIVYQPELAGVRHL